MELQNEKLNQLFQFIDDSKEDMINLWEEIVNIESGTMQKTGVDLLCKRLESELNNTNVSTSVIEMDKVGNFLVGDWGTENKGKPLMFLGHMDTVFKEGAVAKNPFRIEGEKAFGPGVLDMKAGLVIAVYVLKGLNQIGYNQRPIKIAFAGDEENSHALSNAGDVMLELSKGMAAAFNFETGYVNDGLVVGRKGSFRLTINIDGIASHSGNAPEAGRSAILEASHKIIALEALNDYENGTSINVGLVSGGVSVNTVPHRCSLEVDVRYTKRENLDLILEKIDAIVDTVYIDGTSSSSSKTKPGVIMEDSKEVMALFNHIADTADKINYGKVHPIKVGGWSDSSLIASMGIPVVCGLGVKGSGNHSPSEYALVDSLFSRAKLIGASILALENDLV
ncbi:MAG: M20 family metallopeptidase [Peptostreptococcaceae bacterium]